MNPSIGGRGVAVRFIGAETKHCRRCLLFHQALKRAGFLSNQPISFLALPRLMLGLPPYQSLFWIFWGFVSFIQSDSFPDFFQARLQLFMSSLWFLLHMPRNSASLLGFYCTCVYLHLLPLGLYWACA